MKRAIGFALIIIANFILADKGITLVTWEWWVIAVCICGWSALND
jgi:hypothetical protein